MLMIHQSSNKGGMSGMDMVEKVKVPAGGMVKFAPGGYHLMCDAAQDEDRRQGAGGCCICRTAARWRWRLQCRARRGSERADAGQIFWLIWLLVGCQLFGPAIRAFQAP